MGKKHASQYANFGWLLPDEDFIKKGLSVFCFLSHHTDSHFFGLLSF